MRPPRVSDHWVFFVSTSFIPFARQNGIFPLCANPRLPDDALFFICESDHCFYQEDAEVREILDPTEHLPHITMNPLDYIASYMTPQSRQRFRSRMERFFLDLPEDRPYISECGTVPRQRPWGECRPGADKSHPAYSEKMWDKDEYEFVMPENMSQTNRELQYVRGQGKAAKDNISLADCTTELKDLLCTVNTAARAGRGGWIWLSFNSGNHWSTGASSKKRKTVPSTGGFMSALTTEAARYLLLRIREEKFQRHTGTWMLELLREYQTTVGACYVSPPIGHYLEHTSSWNNDKDTLPTHWRKPWVQEGTRVLNSDKDWERHVCHYDDKGSAVHLAEVVTDDETLLWITQADDSIPDCFLGPQWWHTGAA